MICQYICPDMTHRNVCHFRIMLSVVGRDSCGGVAAHVLTDDKSPYRPPQASRWDRKE
jgi:hypothetical protein